MVSRRTASIERMRLQGRNPGNGQAPFGYRSAPFADGRPGRRFAVGHDEAQVIREVADRLVSGASASALGVVRRAAGVYTTATQIRIATK